MKRVGQIGVLLVMAIGMGASAGQLDPSWPQQLREACLSSMPRSKVRVKDPQKLCACVAESHFKAAKRESDSTVAEKQLRWVRELYETTDPVRLQALVDSPDNVSETDMDIMESCLAKAKKPGK